jgi:integrase
MAVPYRRPGSPYWYYDVTVDGVRKRRSTKRTKKSEAEAVIATELKAALDRTQLGIVPEITVREALDRYLGLVAQKPSHVHLKRYARYLCGDDAGVVGIGASTKLHLLRTSDVQDYRSRRMAQGMSIQSVNHELKCLLSAVRKAKGSFRVNPDLEIKMVQQKSRSRYLEDAEVEALLADLDPTEMRGRGGKPILICPLAPVAMQRQDNYDLAVCLLDTGCRYGEIAHLTWSMVDTRDFEWVNIYRSKVDNESRLTTTLRLREVLRRRWAQRGNHQYVFPSWKRGAKDAEEAPRGSTAAIRRAMNRIGINSAPNVRRFGRRDCRSLRDTFATKLVRNGVDIARVQKLLGHTTPAMTMKYADLQAMTVSQEAAALLDQLNGG